MTRMQSSAFQELVRRCSEEIIRDELVVMAHRHKGAFIPALQLVLSWELDLLKQLGKCSPHDASQILASCVPDTAGEGEGRAVESSVSEEELEAVLARAIEDISQLFLRATARFEPLVVLDSLAIALGGALQVLVDDGEGALVEVALQVMEDDTSDFGEVSGSPPPRTH